VTARVDSATGLRLMASPTVPVFRIAKSSYGPVNPPVREDSKRRAWNRWDTRGRTVYASDSAGTAYIEALAWAHEEAAGRDRAIRKTAELWLPTIWRDGRRMYQLTRDGLEKALAAVREGDTLVVPSLDRLGRNTRSVLEVMQTLADRGAVLSNGGNLYNPHNPMAKLYFTILAAAEAEGGWVSLRTLEGLAVVRARGRLLGRRKPTRSQKQDAAIARHCDDGEMTSAEIAAVFNTSHAGDYRALNRHRERTLQEGALNGS